MTKIFLVNNFRSAFKNRIEGCASDEVAALL